jgi:hypothetical protein
MRIGVIAENPNDFVAVARFLKQKYSDYQFFQLIKRFTGSQLDDKNSNMVLHVLINEIQSEQPDFLLYIRDLDATMADDEATGKIKNMKDRFKKFAKQKPEKSIFMLNIYELEALILADFEAFKTYYKNTDWHFDSKNAANTPDPKGLLQTFTTYNEGNARDIFPRLNIKTVIENHRFFAAFLLDFDKMLDQKSF